MIRRIVDIAVALIALPFLMLLFAVVSLAIVLESPGRPYYRGRRVGKDGKPFLMWKFRTMVSGADRIGGAVTTPNDPRITKVGRFLRNSKLDELPQFLNLLTGDITLIGPRPEDPSFVAKYTPEQREILSVKPGITGPTQLHYTGVEAEVIPDGANADQYYIEHLLAQKIGMDIEYARRRTFFSDCRVLWQSISLIMRAVAGPQSSAETIS
jgi:lipopolysaccharide/colanic/teichoic acid biosynthesis glycosyltransferase